MWLHAWTHVRFHFIVPLSHRCSHLINPARTLWFSFEFYSCPSPQSQVMISRLYQFKRAKSPGMVVKELIWLFSVAPDLVLKKWGQLDLNFCLSMCSLSPGALSKPPQLATCWQCWCCCSRCCVSVLGSISLGALNAADGGSAWRGTLRHSHVHTLKRQQEKKIWEQEFTQIHGSTDLKFLQ